MSVSDVPAVSTKWFFRDHRSAALDADAAQVKPARRSQAEINQSVLSVDHLRHGIGNRTARGGAIVMSSQLVRIFVQLSTTFFLARLLAPADFGVVAIGYTSLALLALFTDLGLSTVTVQTPNLDQDTTSALLIMNVGLTLIAAVVAALAEPLLILVFKDPRIPLVVAALAATTPISALGSQHAALLMRNMKWMPLQGVQLGAMIVGSLTAILSARFLHIGYWALVVQAFATAIFGSTAAWMLCPWRPSLVRNWTNVRTALRTSLNMSGTMAVNFLHRQMDVILIGWHWGSTELGFYSRGMTMLMLPLNLVTGPLATAIIPALSRLQHEPTKWREAYLDALIVVTVMGGGIAAVFFGAAYPIVEILLGPRWERSAAIFSNLVLAMLAATPMSTVVWIYVSLGRTARMFQWGIIGTTAYVSAFAIGLPYGAPGVALAYGIAQILAAAPCLWMATRRTSVRLVDVAEACLPITAITILVGVALRFATGHFGLFFDVILSGLAGLAYLGLVTLVGWRWAPHRRVRDRIIKIVQPLLARREARNG